MTDRADFSDVDSAQLAPLVDMMAATDAWPAVRAARHWTLDQVHHAAGSGPLLDVGCGPGTVGAMARHHGWATVELDRSSAMLGALRRLHGDRPVAAADVSLLPARSGSFQVARCERVLQWTADPAAGLGELWRAVAPGGWVAVTDTDWSTFEVQATDPATSAVLAAAALGWVPHPSFAAALVDRLDALGATELRQRVDRVHLRAWDPDDPAQRDGPPGLPLHSIAAGAEPDAADAARAAVASVADTARSGRFSAGLTIVTVLARR